MKRGLSAAALGLLALALLVRVVVVLVTPDYTPLHDDRDYDRLACWVAEHGAPPDRAPPTPGPHSCVTHGRAGPLTGYRPPLWPLALGGTYAVANVVGIPRWTAGRLLQAAIGTVVAGFVGLIAAELWGGAVGLIALGLAAIFLPLALDGASLISEPLFVALALAAVLAAMRHRRSGAGLRWAIVAGALVGLAALTRANGAVLALPLIAAVATRPGGRSPAAAAALAATAILVVAPWTIRNARVLHAFVPVSTETGPTLLGTYNTAARELPGCTGCWVLIGEMPGEQALARRLHRLGEVERDRESRRLVLRYVRRHPGYVAQVAWENSLRLLELGGTQRTRFTARTIDVPAGAAVVGAWQLWLVLALAVLGAALGALRRVPIWLIALPVLLWITTVLVQSETPRFRAPIDPFIVMLGAAGAALVSRRAAARRSRAPGRRAPSALPSGHGRA